MQAILIRDGLYTNQKFRFDSDPRLHDLQPSCTWGFSVEVIFPFFSEIVEPLASSLSVAGNFLTDLGLDVIKTEGEETSVGLSDVLLPPASQVNRIILKIKPVVNEDTLGVINTVAFNKNITYKL